MKGQSWTSLWLSPTALSNAALAWATGIGAFGTLVLVPGPASTGLFTWQWVMVVAASQGAFALVILALRPIARRWGPWSVLGTLAIAGIVRGLVIALGVVGTGIAPLTAALIVGRCLNSAVISVIGVALIGATLTWRADFRRHYRILRERAILVGDAAHDGESIDPSVLDAWTTMKVGLDATLNTATDQLASGASKDSLDAAAATITRAIDVDLRPAARAMWQGSIPTDQPLRLRALLTATLADWRLPLVVILGFLAVVVGVGSVVRSGLLEGGAYTARYLIVTGTVLWLSTAWARRRPGWAPTIAVTTLILLPPLILASDHYVGDLLQGLPQDPTGQIVVALQTPVTTILIAMSVQAIRARQQVLDALQARIDSDAAFLRRRDDRVARDSQRLSLFVHHSVQSELAAIAMQLTEAASTHDARTMEVVRQRTLEHLDRLQQMEGVTVPWAPSPSDRSRIVQISDAWRGLLDIRLQIPEEGACRPDQWYVAAQVIEEALANAARHGGASQVVVTGALDDGALVLQVRDDGAAAPLDEQPEPGLGTQWLDRIAPGQWQLQRSRGGAHLTVRIG